MAQALSQPLHTAEIAVAAVAIPLGVGIGVYALGSFLLMSRYTARRALGESMRELVREIVVAALTQPILPLFYLFGRRMGGARDGVPVVFVHGYMQNRIDFVYLARALARRGLGPLYGFNYPWLSSVEANARRLDRFVERVCAETSSTVVDLVCHSMGGVVAMEMMRGEASRERLRVRRCVTIASPHGGVAWRGPVLGLGAASLRRGSQLLEAHAGVKLSVPCLSVYSSHDNVVHPKETAQLALRGGRDVEVPGVAHLAILFSRAVADHVATFLSEAESPEASSAPPP